MPFKLTIEQYVSDGEHSVCIPPEVTRLDAHAFRNCVNLEELDIPEGVVEIVTIAFLGARICKLSRFHPPYANLAPMLFPIAKHLRILSCLRK